MPPTPPPTSPPTARDLPAPAADGRIDTHSHLLPGIDDGCRDVAESIECARRLVSAGYTHAFCTSHAGSLDAVIGGPSRRATPGAVRSAVGTLQGALDGAGVALTLVPGGEYSLEDGRTPPTGDLLTYGMAGRFLLFDFWAHSLPTVIEPFVRRLKGRGIRPILAHPERVPAIQRDPGVLDAIEAMGVKLQGNLAPLTDPVEATRRTAERLLGDGRYWLLGSDTHRLDSLPWRINGLAAAERIVGRAEVDRLTRVNPRELLATR